MSFLTEHIRDTEVPQTYFQHGWFAFSTSCALIGAGIIGIIHAIFPWWFRFYTAEQIIKFYIRVKKSGRHDDLIYKYKRWLLLGIKYTS